MPKAQFKATAHLQEGVQVIAKSRNFQITIDEPKELGGKDTGMNPVELLLCSLGACQAIVARIYAQKFDIEFTDLWIEATGELDTDGFLLKSDVRPGYQKITYNVNIETNAPREKVEEFVEFIERTCPVGDTIEKGTIIERDEIIIQTPTAV